MTSISEQGGTSFDEADRQLSNLPDQRLEWLCQNLLVAVWQMNGEVSVDQALNRDILANLAEYGGFEALLEAIDRQEREYPMLRVSWRPDEKLIRYLRETVGIEGE